VAYVFKVKNEFILRNEAGDMSRKDPRRILLVPVDARGMALLRVLARGGSLGNALRRLVEQGGGAGQTGAPVRYLPVQLPRRARAMVMALARIWGVSEAQAVAMLLAGAQNDG